MRSHATVATPHPPGIAGGNLFRHGSSQALYQLLGLVITLAIAISSGALVGFVVNRLSAVVKPQYTVRSEPSVVVVCVCVCVYVCMCVCLFV